MFRKKLTFATGEKHLLSGHPFYVQWVRTPDSLVSFCTGQPLGYLSSWPLFVLSHHVYILACAEKVYPSAYFDRYAILGDDVVIADEAVAQTYLEGLRRFDIPVSVQNTLVSNNRSFEFAKRFFTCQGKVNLSPVSVSGLHNAHHPYGLMSISLTYPIKRFSTLLRIGGFRLGQIK